MAGHRTLRPLFLFVSFAAAATAVGETSPSLSDLVNRYDELAVGGDSRAVSNLRLSAGHLSLVLVSGQATAVRAGNDVVGVYFRGKGTLDYQSVDPIEWPVMSHNLRKSSSIQPVKTATTLGFKDTFDEVLWLTSGHPVPALDSTEGGSLADAFRAHRARSTRIRGAPLSHAFSLARRDAPASPLVIATLFGGKEDFLYRLDSIDTKSETLALLRKTESGAPEPKGFWRLVVSEQPIARDRRDPVAPRFLLTDVDVSVVASSGRDAHLTVMETIVPQGSDQSVFRFDLYSTVANPVGAAGWDMRAFRVESVKDETGRALAWHHQNDEIVVGFDRMVPADKPAKLRFEIGGNFLVRPSGDNYWLLGVEPWFPQPDFGGQYYTLTTTTRVKKPFVPFAPGTTVSRRSEGDDNVLETRLDKPVQFAVVLAGKYEFEEETRNGVTIRVASYGMKNKRAFKQLTDLAFGIIEFYEKFLGPFPFPEFNILEINSFGFGQAPPGVMFITKEAFNPLGGSSGFGEISMNQLFSQGANERFAHEIAHEYWAHVVKMPNEEEQWLTESFAEYCAALFLKALKGQSTYNNLVDRWRSRASDATAVAPIPLGNRVYHSDPFTRFSLRTALIYDKGAYLLAMLHKELGDQTFLTFLKSYQKTFRWKFGSTRHVAGLLQFLSKKDYMPFFEQNYWGTGMPAR
ncbi:MAG: M1 family aminopeptidase [Acidobacteriota bacterium]